ncbi:MAG: hypothetical protein DWH70_01535 [Planctomycetota bacterium]|nr:MAG: hypothetical protein DWH70_01535 [Planctomycetota bacterium]
MRIRSLASGPACGLAPRSPSRGGLAGPALRSPSGLPASGLPASGRLSPSRGGFAGPALRSPSGLPASGLPASGRLSPSRGGFAGPALLLGLAEFFIKIWNFSSPIASRIAFIVDCWTSRIFSSRAARILSTLARSSLFKFNSFKRRSLASGAASGRVPRSPSRAGLAGAGFLVPSLPLLSAGLSLVDRGAGAAFLSCSRLGSWATRTPKNVNAAKGKTKTNPLRIIEKDFIAIPFLHRGEKFMR